MKIETVKVDKLKPFERNPKIHPESQLKLLRKSISEHGWTNPILATKEGMIVAGHARLEAAKQLNLAEVPVIYLDMPYERAIAYVVADNRLAELAETDTTALLEILNELVEIPDFDIELTGFEMDDIDTMVHDMNVHDARYKPGEGSITGSVDFVEDEAVALAADDDAKERFKEKSTIMVTFSGGKDSSFALLWAKTNFPDKRIVAVFSDTGVEFPGFPAHIKECCEFFEVEWKIVKPEKDMWIEITKYGWPNIIHRWCQQNFVYAPINAYYKTLDPKDFIIIDGSRADQSTRTTRKTKTSPPADKTMHKFDFYHPAFDVDRDTQEHILVKSGMPIWDGYNMGFGRTACWMCPGQNSTQAFALSQNYPGLVETIRRWEKKLGTPLQSSNGRSIDDLIETGRKKHIKKTEPPIE